MKKILIIRLSALGDVAMTIPAIYSLALSYPDVQITVLTKPFFARLFVNRPENVSFVLFEKQYQNFPGLYQLIRQLHLLHFDLVADFHNIVRSWIIDLSFLLCGTKVCMVQKRRQERKRLLAGVKQGIRIVTQPYISRYYDVLEKLGFTHMEKLSAIPQMGTNPLPECTFEPDGKKWIGIAPFARYTNKTYPTEKMKQVVRLLVKEEGVRVFLFGSKDDIPVLSEWAKESYNITCVAGTMQIEQELALMSQLDVMLSMDSANQHMAALVGTRVVSIWGSTTYHCGFMGWKQKREDALWAKLPCQPCTIAGSKICPRGDLVCMNAITPEAIVKKLMKE